MIDAFELILGRNPDTTCFSLVPDGDAFSLCGLPLVGRDVCELHGPVTAVQNLFRDAIHMADSYGSDGVLDLSDITLCLHHLVFEHAGVHLPVVFLCACLTTSGRAVHHVQSGPQKEIPMCEYTNPTPRSIPSSPAQGWGEPRDLDLLGSGKSRHDIRQWVANLELDLNAWAKKLTVRSFNHLRMAIEDAAERALRGVGYSDRVSDFSSPDVARPSSSEDHVPPF